jgi:hypothetical protein
VNHSTGGEVARYLGRHGSKRAAKAVWIGAAPPLTLKTAAKSRRLANGSFRPDPRGRAQRPGAVLQGATLKVIARGPHGMCSTLKDQINTELLVFFKGAATGASE